MSQHTEPSGRPGRYQRSFGGLVASLAVTAIAIVGVLWVMGLFRNETEIEVEPIDLDVAVRAAQDAGLQPVYPDALPEDFDATGAEVPADGDGFEIRLLRDDEDGFIGIRQAAQVSGTGLLTTYVDEEPTEGEPTEIASGLDVPDDAWETWTDGDGDTAYLAEVATADGGTENVIVYGSASADEIRAVVERLTREPVPAGG